MVILSREGMANLVVIGRLDLPAPLRRERDPQERGRPWVLMAEGQVAQVAGNQSRLMVIP